MNQKHKEFFRKLSEIFKEYNAIAESDGSYLFFTIDGQEYSIPMFQAVFDEEYDALVYSKDATRYFNFMDNTDEPEA
jgi:hypothetical protein